MYEPKFISDVYNNRKEKGKMSLEEIKEFLSVQASFVSKHNDSALTVGRKCPWGTNSYTLNTTVGAIDENNPFDYDRT